MRNLVFLVFALLFAHGYGQNSYQVAVLKYNGGGDWYANPTAVPNLVKFCNQNIQTTIDEEVPFVDVGSPDIYNYPFIHMTGHGNVVFSSQEVDNLRAYLTSGGFLHIDDNYGMDQFIRPQLKKIFPESELVEIPFSHPIYHQTYNFNDGLPKVHEHDGKPAQGFGIFHEGRLVCFYSYECDLGDGWEDKDTHNDSEEIHTEALQMGSNIVEFVFMGDENKQ